jgi:hypothetical protein
MSLLKDAIQSLVAKGKIIHEFSLQGMKFEMRVLTAEELLLSEGMVDPDKLKEKYQAAESTNTFRDTVDKFRLASNLSFAIAKIDGKSPVDEKALLPDQFKQRLEFRDEILSMTTSMVDHLTMESNKCVEKQRAFLINIEENAGK